MGGIGNQFKDVRIFKNQIFNLMRNFMAGIKLKAQGLGVDGILRIPSIDARGSFQTIREVFRQFKLTCQKQKLTETLGKRKVWRWQKEIAFSSKPKVVRERAGRKDGKFSDNLG